MEQNAVNINRNKSILISRNAPIAFVVGAGGFIGSTLVDELLSKNIQVIAIDDFSSGFRKNLDGATKNKAFHLINGSIAEPSNYLKDLNLPRLDYAFFLAESENPSLYSLGLHNFLQFIKSIREQLSSEKTGEERKIALEKPKVAFVSSIDLYKRALTDHQKDIKEAEIKLAKFAKYYKLNARLIRLAGVYGPRMHFNYEDPMIRLIYSRIIGDIQKEITSMEFSTRAIYIDDAILLITKSILGGSTSHKIYDGALLQPIKVAEIKQILLDPVWYELKHFEPSELPPWPTPNLERTTKELNWKAKAKLIESIKKTLNYFERNEIPRSTLEEKIQSMEDKAAQVVNPENLKRWSFSALEELENSDNKKNGGEEKAKEKKGTTNKENIKKRTLLAGALLLILYALILPVTFLIFGAFNIKGRIEAAQQAVVMGDFKKAKSELNEASSTLKESRQIIDSLAVLRRVEILSTQIAKLDRLILIVDEGINGITHAMIGTEALFKTPKIISGEVNEDPMPYYNQASLELTSAAQKIAKVKASLDDEQFLGEYPNFIQEKARDLDSKLSTYLNLVEKGRVASVMFPELTAVNSKKSYLVLLQNNLELRSGGGFITSYAKLDFEKGKLLNIKVDDIYNLDKNLQDQITPPSELRTDLGIERLFLRDSNYEIDFPTSARQADYLYKREAGESVNGVIALNLTAASKLLAAVDGVEIPEYSEVVKDDNLYEKVLTRSQTNLIESKKSYLTIVYTQLLNKIFFSKQNWSQVAQALGSSLEEKHLIVYLADPSLFSTLTSQNWAGVLPRGVDNKEGIANDFLAPIEANYGLNMVNYYLQRSYNLQTNINKEGQISHKLEITYNNNSPSEVAPAGKYKARFKIYLPLGSKLSRAVWGDTDITNSVTSFSDYNRGAYTLLLELAPKEQKILLLEYSNAQGLVFKEDRATYRLDLFKQPGKMNDPFIWTVTLPTGVKAANLPEKSNLSGQKFTINTEFSRDRSFIFSLQKVK